MGVESPKEIRGINTEIEVVERIFADLAYITV